jgi:hypothetical protein
MHPFESREYHAHLVTRQNKPAVDALFTLGTRKAVVILINRKCPESYTLHTLSNLFKLSLANSL